MTESASKIGIVSLGCPKALVDSERILSKLRAEGYDLSGEYAGADLVIVNTCGFLDTAKAESLDAIGEAIQENGEAIEIFDHITFEIGGSDSTFTRITNHKPWTYDFNNPSTDNDTIVGNWTWGYALEGNFNKQFITYSPGNLAIGPEVDGPRRHLRITVLSNDELVLQDQTYDNTTYHYAPL